MAEWLNLMEPGITRAVLVCILLGLVCLLLAVRHIRRQRLLRSGLQGLFAVVLLGLAGLLGLVGINLHTYQHLTYEKPVAELDFRQLGPQRFRVRLIRMSGRSAASYELNGDEWQIDARVLKWKPPATLLGLNARYRLERLSGRYRDINRERELPRTVYDLAPAGGQDVWNLLGDLRPWLGWVDTYYGNAAYLPMADAARFEVSLDQSGLVARPANDAARRAVNAW